MNFLIKIVDTRKMFVLILLGCLKCVTDVDVSITNLLKSITVFLLEVLEKLLYSVEVSFHISTIRITNVHFTMFFSWKNGSFAEFSMENTLKGAQFLCPKVHPRHLRLPVLYSFPWKTGRVPSLERPP